MKCPLCVFALLAAISPALAADPPRYVPRTDPARLARIKAAKLPPITKPIPYNSPEADAIVSALEIFPADNPWNTIIEDWPVHPNSNRIVESVGADKPLRCNPDMTYVIVPPGQPKVNLVSVHYKDESDPGPFPIPDNTPIEGWPTEFLEKKVTLDDVQRDTLNTNSDRHACVLDPTAKKIYEFYQMKKTDKGWLATQTSVFDLTSNKLRPDGWTSTDAAGLPIFPAIIRHDELQRGMVEHAMRFSVRRSRRAYVFPATHFASRLNDENLPRMGERFRLRADYDISKHSPNVQAILKGLKKYGMYMADNGIEWGMSSSADDRVPVMHEELRRIKGSDFEVVTAPPGYVRPK